MKAKEYASGGLEVEVCDYHTHEKQLAHLNDGVSISSILDFVRDNVDRNMTGSKRAFKSSRYSQYPATIQHRRHQTPC